MSTVIDTQRLHELLKCLPPPPQRAGEYKRLAFPESLPVTYRREAPLHERIKLTDVGIMSVEVEVDGERKAVWAICDVAVTQSPNTELIDREGLRVLKVAARKLTEDRAEDVAVHGYNFAMATFKPLAEMLRMLARHGMFRIETDSEFEVTGFWL